MQEIDIGALSKLSGLSTATIRFYESKNLIKSIGRKGLRRQYLEQTLTTLKLIKFLRKGGVSIAEIQKIFLVNQKISINRESLKDKIINIELQIQYLTDLHRVLQHIETCPFEDHISCPDFNALIWLE